MFKMFKLFNSFVPFKTFKQFNRCAPFKSLKNELVPNVPVVPSSDFTERPANAKLPYRRIRALRYSG